MNGLPPDLSTEAFAKVESYCVGWSGYMIPLELTLSKIAENLQRASRVLRTPVCTPFLQRRKARHAIPMQNGLGFAKLFCGREDSQNRD